MGTAADLRSQATTTRRVAAPQFVGIDCRLNTTVADATPEGFLLGSRRLGSADNSEFPKALAQQIVSAHPRNYTAD